MRYDVKNLQINRHTNCSHEKEQKKYKFRTKCCLSYRSSQEKSNNYKKKRKIETDGL